MSETSNWIFFGCPYLLSGEPELLHCCWGSIVSDWGPSVLGGGILVFSHENFPAVAAAAAEESASYANLVSRSPDIVSPLQSNILHRIYPLVSPLDL